MRSVQRRRTRCGTPGASVLDASPAAARSSRCWSDEGWRESPGADLCHDGAPAKEFPDHYRQRCQRQPEVLAVALRIVCCTCMLACGEISTSSAAPTSVDNETAANVSSVTVRKLDECVIRELRASSTSGFGSAIAWWPGSDILSGVLAVGAPDDGSTEDKSGAVRLYRLSDMSHVASCGPPGSRMSGFGASLAWLDRHSGRSPLLVVGAPGSERSPGCVVALDIEDWSAEWQVSRERTREDGLGTSLAVIDDRDTDGVPDVLAGAPWATFDIGLADMFLLRDDDTPRGAVMVISGSGGRLISEIEGPNGSTGFGYSIATGSGPNDLRNVGMCVGAGNSGRFISAMSIREDAVVWKRLEPDGVSGLGRAVAAIGDVTGDGITDFAAGCNGVEWSPDHPRIMGLSGSDGGVIWESSSLESLRMTGKYISAAGDVSGDGQPDPFSGGGRWESSPATVAVYDGTTGMIIAILTGDQQSSEELGRSVVEVADIDGDGFREFAVTDPGAFDGRGRIHFVSGMRLRSCLVR